MAEITLPQHIRSNSLVEILKSSRSIEIAAPSSNGNVLSQLSDLSDQLKAQGHQREADAFLDTLQHCTADPDFGGFGFKLDHEFKDSELAEVTFCASAYLEALNYQDRKASPPAILKTRPEGRRGMTVAEKILAAHDVAHRGEVKPGDVIRVDVDWVMASELSWFGMEKTYDSLGKPGIFRNDRVWIAGDHLVDPRALDHPKIKPLIEASERARQVFKLTEYQGMNYTIMHTEFSRERAQPGMLIIGSDSHTCSAGCVSSLAIGLGVADVTLPLVTGETWIKVPETVEIRFINKPKPGLGGKDVILYILKELKRNTVAAERIVEYTGPGLQHLSCDARFAFCNMTTEFGGVSGVCVPDEITKEFVDKRKNPKYKKLAQYFRPDDDAQYAESHIIDLDKVEPFIARYPSPDDVVPVGEVAGTSLDGCFIGACTTAREDLVLAALVLEAGLKKGLKPISHGKRKVVPGSRPILHDLRQRGLDKFYEEAGFEIGVPGCSYCVGMSVDKAGKDEVWLSSQNRNFQNRMGPGAIGSIASAVTVAASSFDMKITDPTSLLDEIDMDRLEDALGAAPAVKEPMEFVEPPEAPAPPTSSQEAKPTEDVQSTDAQSESKTGKIIRGKVQVLEDFIDTDALAPAEALAAGRLSPEQMGEYCLYHTHPDFRRLAKHEGHSIVVAGKAFGCGSSRENAVTALTGTGVQCVIARSFAFIYARNQPNLGLLGIVMEDDGFYELAQFGAEVEVDVDARKVKVGGKEFPFTLSELEIGLWQQGGMSAAFKTWGKGLLERMTGTSKKPAKMATMDKSASEHENLKW